MSSTTQYLCIVSSYQHRLKSKEHVLSIRCKHRSWIKYAKILRMRARYLDGALLGDGRGGEIRRGDRARADRIGRSGRRALAQTPQDRSRRWIRQVLVGWFGLSQSPLPTAPKISPLFSLSQPHAEQWAWRSSERARQGERTSEEGESGEEERERERGGRKGCACAPWHVGHVCKRVASVGRRYSGDANRWTGCCGPWPSKCFFFLRSKFTLGPSICRRVWNSSLNNDTRYDVSLNS